MSLCNVFSPPFSEGSVKLSHAGQISALIHYFKRTVKLRTLVWGHWTKMMR